MKYRKTNKPLTNSGNKPYCKRILFNKTNGDYAEPELKQNKKKDGQMFIPPVHKNKYIYPSNVSQKECKEDETDTNTSVNESAFQNDLTPRKEQVIIQTQRKEEKNEIISRNAIKVNRINNDDNNPINSIKALNSTTSTLRDLIKSHKKANSELFFKEIDYSKSFSSSIKSKDNESTKCVDNNNSNDDNTNNNSNNKKQLRVNFTNVVNSTRQTNSNQKKCSSLMRDKTVNHLLNNSLLHNSQHVSKFQSKNTSANSSMIQDNNSYIQSIPLTSRTTTKHTLSTSMPCSAFVKNHHHNKSLSSLLTTPIINFQEVLEIQIKLNHILLKIDNNSSPHLELFSWWNYFYNSSFIKAFHYFFENNNNKRIVDSSLKLESLTAVLCLEISKVNTKCRKALELFKSIFSLTHFNFLIFIKFLLVKSKTSNVFADKLNNIIKNELSDNIYNRDMTESFVAELIKHNTKNIALYYKELIQKFYIDNKYSNSNNLNNSRYLQRNKQNATRNIRINKKEENENESIYYTFFTNAFSNLNAYTYDDYNNFIVEYINNDDFDYNLDNENVYFKTVRNNSRHDSNKILDFSDNFKNGDVNSNSIDIVMPDNLSAISMCSSQKDNSPRIQNKHRRTNSCTTTTISNSSFPLISDLLNQLMPNNNGSQTDRNDDTKFTHNENENSFLNYNKGVLTSRSKSPNYPKQCPLLNSMYFLPEISNQHEYTLILDLDETLVHVIIDNKPNSNKAKVIYRPYLFEFLARMKRIYEIVIFTVSTEDYADKVCDCIEKKEKYFDYKLYRQHVTYIGREYYKDLSKLGRDLKRVVIVDNMPQNFALQKENGIAIKAFYGDCSMDKNLLYELGSVLEKIRFDSYEDVRKSIIKYKDIIKNKISEAL